MAYSGIMSADCNSLPESNGKRPAAFLDRDGVLIVDHGYVHRPDQLDWIDNAPAAVRMLNEAGFYVIVVTNQAGVARGYYDEATVNRFHAYMQDRLREHGAHIDAFYYCPHHPQGTIQDYAIACGCRKPGSGLLEQAAAEWPINRDHSFLVGDKDTDLQAAAAFNIPAIHFDGSTSLAECIERQLRRVRR